MSLNRIAQVALGIHMADLGDTAVELKISILGKKNYLSKLC